MHSGQAPSEAARPLAFALPSLASRPRAHVQGRGIAAPLDGKGEVLPQAGGRRRRHGVLPLWSCCLCMLTCVLLSFRPIARRGCRGRCRIMHRPAAGRGSAFKRWRARPGGVRLASSRLPPFSNRKIRVLITLSHPPLPCRSNAPPAWPRFAVITAQAEQRAADAGASHWPVLPPPAHQVRWPKTCTGFVTLYWGSLLVLPATPVLASTAT